MRVSVELFLLCGIGSGIMLLVLGGYRLWNTAGAWEQQPRRLAAQGIATDEAQRPSAWENIQWRRAVLQIAAGLFSIIGSSALARRSPAFDALCCFSILFGAFLLLLASLQRKTP